ncbi:MAG: MFS transporter [Burkholderiales bacterium]|nr:MFS transporter [Burkholderiales bacterium]
MSTAGAGPCDRGAAQAVAAPPADAARPTAHPTGTLAATILGSSLAFVDGSVTNVGLPAIARDLGVGGDHVSWLINAYLLPLGALVLLGGVAGDRWGRKRVFLAGMALFTFASLACAAAPAFGWLLAARAVQGLGAAFMMPASLALIGAAFSGEARGRAVGTWAAAGAVAGALGPLAGGWLIDVVGWRSIFLVNLPLALVAAWLAWRYVDESRSANAQPLDGGGALLATAGLAALTLGLTVLAGERGDGANPSAATGPTSTTLALGALAAGAALLVAFIRLEARLGERAMMPLHLFGTRAFVGVTLLTFFLYAALGGLFVLLPYLLIETGGYSAAAAGAALLPLPVAMGLGSRAAGRLAERAGPRVLLTLGPCIVALGFALFLRTGVGRLDYASVVFPALAVVACGLTLSVAPLTAAVMGAVDAAHVGSASGVNNAVARVAGLLATASLGFVLAAGAKGEAFIAGFHAAAIAACALALLAGLSAFLLVRREGETPSPAGGSP